LFSKGNFHPTPPLFHEFPRWVPILTLVQVHHGCSKGGSIAKRGAADFFNAYNCISQKEVRQNQKRSKDEKVKCFAEKTEPY